MKHLSRILIGLAIFLTVYAGYQIWLEVNPNKLSFANYTNTSQAKSTTKVLPTRITITKAGIDLPIIPSHVSKGLWETTNNGASYLLSSPIPGETGNSIMYAHNWNNLFGPLNKVKSGDIISIQYADGAKKEFKVANIKTVSSQDSSVLDTSLDQRVTLYTCSGWFDEKRLVVIATPIEK